MPDTSPTLALPLLMPAQAQNTSRTMRPDAVGPHRAGLCDFCQRQHPPVAPATGALYLPTAGATGDWAGRHACRL